MAQYPDYLLAGLQSDDPATRRQAMQMLNASGQSPLLARPFDISAGEVFEAPEEEEEAEPPAEGPWTSIPGSEGGIGLGEAVPPPTDERTAPAMAPEPETDAGLVDALDGPPLEPGWTPQMPAGITRGDPAHPDDNIITGTPQTPSILPEGPRVLDPNPWLNPAGVGDPLVPGLGPPGEPLTPGVIPTGSDHFRRDGGLSSIRGLPNAPGDFTGDPSPVIGAPPFTIDPTRTGEPRPPTEYPPADLSDDATTAATELAGGDPSRGGDIMNPTMPSIGPKPVYSHFDPSTVEEDPYWAPDPTPPTTLLGKMFNNEGGNAHKIGMAMMRGGAALMSGGPDFGAALGQAINAGLDQYVETEAGIKSDKRDRLKDSIDMWKINQQVDAANAETDLKYAQFELERQNTARARLRETAADERQARLDQQAVEAAKSPEMKFVKDTLQLLGFTEEHILELDPAERWALVQEFLAARKPPDTNDLLAGLGVE